MKLGGRCRFQGMVCLPSPWLEQYPHLILMSISDAVPRLFITSCTADHFVEPDIMLPTLETHQDYWHNFHRGTWFLEVKKNNGKLWYDEGGRVQAVQTVKPMAWPILSGINTCNSDRGNSNPLCSCKWSRRVFTIIIAVLLFRLLQYLHSSKTWAASPLALLLAPILRSTTY